MFTKKTGGSSKPNTNDFSFADKLGMQAQLHRGTDPTLMSAARSSSGSTGNTPNKLFGNKGGQIPKGLDWGGSAFGGGNFDGGDFDEDIFGDDELSKPSLGGGGSKNLGGVDFASAKFELVDAPTTSMGTATLKASMLSVAPLYMEAATTFVSDLSARLTVSALEKMLEEGAKNGVVEYEMNLEGRQQIRGTILMPNRANFVVQFYKSRRDGAEATVFPARGAEEGGGKIVVEFQRRSGCARAFHAFYHDALDSFTGEWYRKYSPQPFAGVAHSAPVAFEGCDFDDVEVELDFDFADTVGTLVTMAACDLGDMKREALKALVMVAKDDNSKAKLASVLQGEQAKKNLLRDLLASEDAECRAYTETLMKSLSLS